MCKKTKPFIIRDTIMMMKKNNHLNVDRVQSNPCIDRDGEESEPIKLDIYSMDRTALRKMVVDIWSP